MEAAKVGFLHWFISSSWHLILHGGILLDNADMRPASERARLSRRFRSQSFELAFFASAPNQATR
jgi:hypothetical protein